MVGLLPSGSAETVRRRPALIGAAALLAGVVGVSLLAPTPPASAGPGPGCATPTATLTTTKGTAKKRYTMLLRIQKDKNIDEYVNPDFATGGLRKRIRDRDIFLINTRQKGSTPEDWVAWTERLRAEFPCNRIVALNGLGFNPSKPGYFAALTNNPGIWGLSLDWESGDWNDGRQQNPAVPAWTERFGTSRKRIGKRMAQLGQISESELGPPGRRTGVVPAYYEHWDYGLIAKTVDRRNLARKPKRRGFQVVQTQAYCALGPESFLARANKLILQYRPKPRIKIIKRKGKKPRRIKIPVKPRAKVANLGLEVSFSNTPDPSDPRPVASLPPGPASKCTRLALKRGVSAFLYWAHPDSIRALFSTARICRLRPPC